MKVLVVASAFPRAAGDIITPWLVEMIHRLQERGIAVEVLAPAYRGSGDHVVHGVRVHRFRYAPARWETLTHDQTAPDRVRKQPSFLALVPFYMLSGSVAAVRLARSGGFDVVHALWPVPHGLIGIAAKHFARVPLVCTFFGVELTWVDAQLPFLRPLLRAIVRASDAVTAISSYTAERLKQVAPDADPAVIPFGAAVDAPTALLRDRLRSPSGVFELLFVGRLVERKGVHVLLQALAQLRSSHAVCLRIVGDGPERVALESRVAALGVEDQVTFEGVIPREQLEEHFASCDGVVLPAVTDAKGDTEGLGVVLIEAMSYGRPVIASAVGGIIDIVKHEETGLLVPPGDPAALAAAIGRYASDPTFAHAVAACGREYVAREFSWDTIVDRLSERYNELVSRADSRQQATSTAIPSRNHVP